MWSVVILNYFLWNKGTFKIIKISPFGVEIIENKPGLLLKKIENQEKDRKKRFTKKRQKRDD